MSLHQKKWQTNYSNSVKVASFHVLEHKQFDSCRSNYETKVDDYCSRVPFQCGYADGDSGTDKLLDVSVGIAGAFYFSLLGGC